MRIGIIGSAGRMGQALVREITAHPSTTVAGGVTLADDPLAKTDIGLAAGIDALGITPTTDAASLFKKADAVIDFTTPNTTLNSATLAQEHDTILVSGTTGFTNAQKDELKTFATHAPIIWSSNMSIGVNLLFVLTEQVAAALDEQYDIEILEMHHRHKADSPSGTALSLGEAAASGRNVALNDVECKTRDGMVGARPTGEIGFATLRGGDVIGDHSVIFASEGDRIELTHKASNRNIFAKGAIHACLWANSKKAGFYTMKDVMSQT